MESFEYVNLRSQLNERRGRLNRAIEESKQPQNLVSLLQKVDTALERMDNGSYGMCDFCHETIEEELLASDPCAKFCIAHLSEDEQRHLEQDLGLAAKIQSSLLPKNNFHSHGYEISFHYQPAGLVSGDYCDIMVNDLDGSIIFIIGDITGKGIAASMLMTHIHAFVHSMIGFNLPVNELVERVNRLFCESSLYSHFVTMVCGRADKNGKVEICNAGHCLPVLIKKGEVINLDSNGMPVGLFKTGTYFSNQLQLAEGEAILLYTDGLSEANFNDEEYGTERINNVALKNFGLNPGKLIDTYLYDVAAFTRSHQLRDDLTLLAIQRKE